MDRIGDRHVANIVILIADHGAELFLTDQLHGLDSEADAEDAVDEWKFFQQYRTLATDLVIDPQRIRFLQDLNVLLGVQKSEMPFDQVADMSLARDALKLMAG